MKHMCMMEAEQARTSHVTYTLHQTTPNGHLPAKKTILRFFGCAPLGYARFMVAEESAA